ncbi:apolipoprotein D-like [Argopecten irradians]|uniref:apolipoprotein D-like n=1 Tax=Argopecten irradians TaxID=31199 RepID=UPI003711D767
MKQMGIFLAIVFAILATTTGLRLRRSCPTVVTKPDFNITRYAGTWYEARRIANLYTFALKCVKAEYTVLGNGDISVTNSGFTKWFSYPIVATGTATVPNPAEPGRLSVSFNEGSDGPYLVLDTDYDNYAVVYTCTDYYGLFATEIAWILQRNRGYLLQGAETTQINNLFQIYNIRPLGNSDNSNC